MAVDEAIFEASTRGDVPPTLRLYAWEPACLSLGYAQPVADVDEARLHANGWELVRRPTGGRAILHTDELTYSVTGPQDEPILAGEIMSSYRRLSSAILAAVEQIGVGVQALPQEKTNNNCSFQINCPPTEKLNLEVVVTKDFTTTTTSTTQNSSSGGAKMFGTRRSTRARVKTTKDQAVGTTTVGSTITIALTITASREVES